MKRSSARARAGCLALLVHGRVARAGQRGTAAPPRAAACRARRRRHARASSADAAARAARGASAPTVEDEEFIPTEELAPDAAVTFPVDI